MSESTCSASAFEKMLLADRDTEIFRAALSVLATLDQNKPGIGPIWSDACWVVGAYLNGRPVVR